MATKSADPDPEQEPEAKGWWLKRFLKKHHRKLWWLHSFYALFLGFLVMLFAQKGLDYARLLAPMLIGLWVLIAIFFRIHGQGQEQKDKVHEASSKKAKLRFYVMTYFMKNLYQTMLFFLLPFYWKSTTFGHPNATFFYVLTACAFLSTMDVIFDNFLMRFRAVSSVYYGIVLFAGLNLAVPALLPGMAALVKTLVAAGATVVMFWTMHVPFAAFRNKAMLAGFFLILGGAMGGTYLARNGIPPVPMSIADAAVGPKLLDDGRLAMKVTELHTSFVDSMYAVTDVLVPGGEGDRMHHLWRKDGEILATLDGKGQTTKVPGPKGTVRLQSKLDLAQIPKDRAGTWTIDVETDDGQLVGRKTFTVIE